jgi:hypothetical protein
MRTTLTLDEDVASLLKRVRKAGSLGLKEAINEALRRGLRELDAPEKVRIPYRTGTVSLGRCLTGSIDDVSELLAVAEGESFR